MFFLRIQIQTQHFSREINYKKLLSHLYVSFCSFLCVFAVVINKVSLQNTVEGFIGSSVVLPCSSAKHDFKLEDINVHWRQNGRIHVYDIIKGKDLMADQNPQYKNRIKTFPEEYVRRNFSIKLNNLTHADAGEFSCYITHSSYSKQDTVRLFINGV
ncbi:CD276 antigen homolog [Labeo rohita]|uniref:CD276 antigen homolog n=1 Tax=Labeo rohita TaxID=84645 RepID=UPI0021E1E5EA|nr:CD276 antigen homolog [Labeo rohita]